MKSITSTRWNTTKLNVQVAISCGSNATNFMMAKPKIESKVMCVGVFETWQEKSKQLPKIKEFTRHLMAEVDREFGLIINIKKAKGCCIHWCIDHPSIPDDSGAVMPPFEGDEFITENNWNFYLGDAIWAPVHNKGGKWRMTIALDGELLADETFDVEVDDYQTLNDDSFWAGRRKR